MPINAIKWNVLSSFYNIDGKQIQSGAKKLGRFKVVSVQINFFFSAVPIEMGLFFSVVEIQMGLFFSITPVQSGLDLSVESVQII